MLLKSSRVVKRNERFVISLMCVWLKEWESGMIENEYAFALFGRDKKKLEKKKKVICSNYFYIDRDTSSDLRPP